MEPAYKSHNKSLRLLRGSRRFYSLTLEEKVWCLLIFLGSGLIRMFLLIFPFSYLEPMLGRKGTESAQAPYVTHQQQQLAMRVGLFCWAVARHTPWKSEYLVQSIIARLLLRYYDIPCTLCLGVKIPNNSETTLLAHAWLMVGQNIVVGKQGSQALRTLGSYRSPRRH